MTKVTYSGSPTGLSWLVDSDNMLRERLNLSPTDSVTRPTPPTVVNIPTTADKQRTHVATSIQYQQFTNTTSETLDLVVGVYPFANNQKNSRTGEFRTGYTVKQLFEYLEKVLGSDRKKRKASNEYQQKLIGLKYTHTIAGPSTFLMILMIATTVSPV